MLLKFLKGKPLPPIIKMIVPGRRALGEDWSEVTLRPDPTGDFILETKPAEVKPVMNTPIIIPAMSNLSEDEVNFILEGALKAQEYESRHPRRRPVTDAEIHKMVQELWNNYFAEKVAVLKGVSQMGPSGNTQRMKPARQIWNPRIRS